MTSTSYQLCQHQLPKIQKKKLKHILEIHWNGHNISRTLLKRLKHTFGQAQ